MVSQKLRAPSSEKVRSPWLLAHSLKPPFHHRPMSKRYKKGDSQSKEEEADENYAEADELSAVVASEGLTTGTGGANFAGAATQQPTGWRRGLQTLGTRLRSAWRFVRQDAGGGEVVEEDVNLDSAFCRLCCEDGRPRACCNEPYCDYCFGE